MFTILMEFLKRNIVDIIFKNLPVKSRKINFNDLKGINLIIGKMIPLTG